MGVSVACVDRDKILLTSFNFCRRHPDQKKWPGHAEDVEPGGARYMMSIPHRDKSPPAESPVNGHPPPPENWDADEPGDLRQSRWEREAAEAMGRSTESKDEPPAISPVLIRLADVKPQPVEWLWHRRIARGAIAILDADPGKGKSIVSLDIAARVTNGWAMPPDIRGGNGKPGKVLLIGAEDGLANTVKPRLMEFGADMDMVVSLQEVRISGENVPVEIPRDLPAIEDVIRREQIAFITIDPAYSHISAEYDTHKDADMRRLMHKVAAVATRTGVAFLLIRHLNKNANVEQAIYRGGGSIGVVGQARTSLMIGKHPTDASLRVLCEVKNNLSVPSEALAFEILYQGDDRPPGLRWHGTVDLEADEMLCRSTAKQEQRRNAHAKEQDARLLTALDKLANADGVAGYTDVRDLAGLSGDLMARAMARLKADGVLEETTFEQTIVEKVKRKKGKGSTERKRNKASRGLRRLTGLTGQEAILPPSSQV